MCVFAMISLLLLIMAAGIARTRADDFTSRCTNNSSLNGMSFEPVSEDIVGRYRLELCAEVKPEYKEWEVVVRFQNQTSTCVNDWRLLYKFVQHSTNYEYLHFDSNCTHACLTKNFDLIFASCYSIESKFLLEEVEEYPRSAEGKPIIQTFKVNNSYTLAQFTNNTVTVDFIPHSNGITILWHPGVPVQDFEVEICHANVTQTTHEYELDKLPCVNASARCVRAASRAVRCAVPAPPYCISVMFAHVAPWISGRLQVQGAAHIPYTYCPPNASAIDVSGSSWTGVSAAGAVLVVAVVALLLWNTRRALHARKHVLKYWLQTTGNETTPQVETTLKKPSRHILLLHARENDAGQRLVDAFTTILQDATDGQVYSLYSPSVMCLAGAAPGEWVRSAFARPDVAIVLLQTPALQALYASSAGEAGGEVTVPPPLLGTAVAPRTPTFGATLLQYALRLLNDTDVAHSYHKLYVATLSELPIEVFPRVVPYRRYLLPEAASLLATDASADFGTLPPPTSTITTRDEKAEDKTEALDVKQELLNEAVAYFVEVVKENPRYLMDELVVL